MGATSFGNVDKVIESKENASAKETHLGVTSGANAVKTLSGARILFGLIFLFDGIMKWQLIASNQMQGVVGSVNVYNVGALNTYWYQFGLLIAIGETLAGICLALGLFQRPSALIAALIMGLIWAFGGFGGAVPGYWWSGYTDPGGDLMLGLIFLVLVFAPAAYGVASRLRLPQRWGSSSIKDKVLRFLIA